MKINGSTIPSPKNIKRRESWLLSNYKDLPVEYVRNELIKIAHERADKSLEWGRNADQANT